MSSLSILGMARYLEMKNDNLFNNMVLPEGMDRETLENNILVRTADFEVLYSDADFVKEYIGIWSKKWLRTFTKWYEALQITYNPLENYDRMEDWTDTSHNTSNGTVNATAHTGGSSTGNTSGSTESLKSAFDSPAYQPYENNINTENVNTTSIADTSNDTTSNNVEDGNAHRTGRTHGNIGVTTSQQMLQSELDIAEWNLVEKITDIFIQEFCIPVYY